MNAPTAESLAYLAEILQDENTELGPLDRQALLLLVQMFQHGVEEAVEAAAATPDPEPPAEVYEAHGEGTTCRHCECYHEEGDACCVCGEEP
jgi:hypothetical protein